MSDYNKMMALIGSVSIEFSTLAASIGELQLSHDRLLSACKDALACIDGNPVARDLLREVIGKAPNP